jgi:hypothetical protein
MCVFKGVIRCERCAAIAAGAAGAAGTSGVPGAPGAGTTPSRTPDIGAELDWPEH